ncbi:MAG: response regulator transcription factor, partial [Chloroflexota bacterium]|nr:response regulator transcription factor [Chloroflexota bacterium]
MIRIMVVDDHPIVRQGLVAVLGDEPDFEVAGSAASAEAALALIDHTQADVILLDLELPGMDGVVAIPHLLEALPSGKVVVFTAYATDQRVFGAIRAGAKGYLLKGASTAEIARAVRAVHAGESYLEQRIAGKLLQEVRAPRHTGLSQRELGVLRLITAGLSNKQIARSLSITERTVKFHVTSILK